MVRRFALAWMLVCGAGLSASAQQVPFGRDLVPTRAALARVGLERNWMAAAPMAGTGRLIEISLADNLLCAQTSTAEFHVYEADTGRFLWSVKLGDRTGDAFPASANSFAVFVTSSNDLVALDRRTGVQMWTKRLENLPSSPTVCDEDRVIVGLYTGKLVAYNLKGLIKKTSKTVGVLKEPVFAWNWQTNGPIPGRPLLAGPAVAFGSDDGKVYVALKAKPTMLYRFATGSPLSASFAGYGTRMLLVPAADKNVYGIDLWSAEAKWIYSTGAPVLQEPLVAGEDAYVVNSNGALTALDPRTGDERWTVSTFGGRLLAVSPTRVYLESSDEDLFIVDRVSGQIVAEPRATFERAGVNLREYTLGLTNHLNDRLYFATKSGLILCLREQGRVNPVPLRDPKAHPFGYVPPEGIDLNPATAKPEAPPAEETKEKDEKDEKAEVEKAEVEKEEVEKVEVEKEAVTK